MLAANKASVYNLREGDMFYYDPTIVILIPAVILSLIAQIMVQTTFSKYSKVPVQCGMTGAEAADLLASQEGISVSIRPHDGFLSDHFDPRTNTLALSPEVYSGRTVAALGVAAHELGHALQKSTGYLPLHIRSALVPAAQVGSNLAYILFLGGLILSAKPLLSLGILLFSASVLFTLVTLPVEFNASSRALRLLTQSGLVTAEEASGVRKVLNAAALTYVAAALMALLQLLRLILIAQQRD